MHARDTLFPVDVNIGVRREGLARAEVGNTESGKSIFFKIGKK